MTTPLSRPVLAAFFVAACLTLLTACCRPCCPPPIPLADQVVTRGRVDRAATSGAPVATAMTTPAGATLPGGPETSSFLAAYTGARALRANPNNAGSFIWVKPGLDLRIYDQLMIDAVQIVPGPGSDLANLAPELKTRATDTFHQIMVETVEPYYDLVDTPGEHVLRVRLALTDLVPQGETLDGTPTENVGAAALEGELVDGLTGERLLAFVDRVEGSTRGEAVEEKWRPAEGALREWADALLDFLDHWEERLATGQVGR